MSSPPQARPHRQSWLRRAIAGPVLRMLRHGASPRRVAWSLATGFVIGINPIIGSTTVMTLAAAHVARLNHTASQVGTHTAYPVQILLLLPFLRAGSLLFRSGPLPLQAAEITSLVRTHPLQIVRLLWTWEWHAMVVWLGIAVVLTPTLAFVLRTVLQRTMRTAHAQ